MSVIRDMIHGGQAVASIQHAMTHADRRWLTREHKAGRLYRRRGLVFRNVTYWISANRAADLDASEQAALDRMMFAAAWDAACRADRAHRLRQEELPL